MSTLHMFQGSKGTGRAATADKTGATLPQLESGAWEYVRAVNVGSNGGALVGVQLADIRQNIEKDGFYRWPETRH